MKAKSKSATDGVCAHDPEVLVSGFFSDLVSTGYSTATIAFRRSGLRVLLGWLEGLGIALALFDDITLVRFLAHLRRRRTRARTPGGRHRAARAAAKLFLLYLRRLGVAGPVSPIPEDALVHEFRGWLVSMRCVLPTTASAYVAMLKVLLHRLGGDPGRYEAAGIRAVVLATTRTRSHAYAADVLRALRAWLKFLTATGRCRPALIDAVPQLAHWRLGTLPRYLDADTVTRIIDSCDVTSSIGLRDRAILLLLSRLGLRAGDVVALQQCDLDWVNGTIRVCGKSRRETLLPLPQDVGEAIVAYLEGGRPDVADQHVFLRRHTPVRAFATSTSISDVVRVALCRAGVQDAPSRGAHMLRHSAATAMLRAGATLEAVGSVLRHKSPDTTAQYAKVDLAMLHRVVQPWPEVGSC